MSELKYPHLLNELDNLFKIGKSYDIRRIAGCAAETIRNTRHSEWISVDDRLPEEGDMILIVRDLGERKLIECEEFTDVRFWDRAFNHVTHWMPLPRSPYED